jgi:hypothetical protein
MAVRKATFTVFEPEVVLRYCAQIAGFNCIV